MTEISVRAQKCLCGQPQTWENLVNCKSYAHALKNLICQQPSFLGSPVCHLQLPARTGHFAVGMWQLQTAHQQAGMPSVHSRMSQKETAHIHGS